jgi:nitrite reductase (NADH) small subunit
VTLIKVATVGELPPGECKTVRAGSRELALYNVEGTYYALDNRCPHRGGPMGEGELEGYIGFCPWHGWRFDVVTGVNDLDPTSSIPAYPVQIVGADVCIEIEEPATNPAEQT